ncbi:MAG: hypothetical protein ACRCUE_00455 [Bosea sp. (in: a-proteobacteria)]
MLAELALWLGTPVPRALRRHGLLRESVGLWSRGLRQRKAWAAHNANCRRVVADCVGALSSLRTVVVLGSGLLRDVPMDLLLARFERVVLVDAVHLWPVRLAQGFRSKITFVTRDLTGVLISLGAGETVTRTDPLADLARDPHVDLVISANLLSQLALPIVRAIDVGQVMDHELPRRVIEAHLADLAAFNARICLLTDMSYSEVNAAGNVVQTVDLLHGVTLSSPDEAWDWPVSPLGEEDAHAAYVHHVGGWADWKAE